MGALARFTGSVLCAIAALLGSVSPAAAQSSEEEYFKRLSAMQRFVREQKLQGMLSLPASSPASGLVSLGLQRSFFKAHQTWTIEFAPADESMVRMSLNPSDRFTAPRQPWVFDFRVLNLEPSGIARVEVRPRRMPGSGESRPAPGVERVELMISERFTIVRKEIYYQNGRPPQIVPLGTQGNLMLGFEAFPVDLPDLSLTDGRELSDPPPELLKRLKSIEAGRLIDIRTSDLLARPVRVIWADGFIWPLYVRTSAGTATLLAGGRGLK